MDHERVTRSPQSSSAHGRPFGSTAVGVLLLLGLLMSVPASIEAQARGSLVGVVRDEVNGDPVEDAVVSLVEVDREVESDEDGGFVFLDLPLGPATMRVNRAGYGTVVEQVQINEGDLRTFEVFLPRMENMLRELFVPGERSARSRGHAEYEVARNDRHQTALDLLQGQIPGLTVGSQSGDLGKGAAIRIRGVGTIQGTNWPSIYLDGIRIDTRGPGTSVTGNGLALGVLETIPADQVERIRVLSGPAATSRYQDGANGVIVIETVRGGSEREQNEGDDG